MNAYVDYPIENESIRKLYSISSEQTVLGIVLLDPSKLQDTIGLQPGDFYDSAHQMLFSAYQNLSENNQPIDISIVIEYFERRGGLGKVGGVEYLVDLGRQVGSTLNMASHSKIIINSAKERKLVAIAQDIKDVIYEKSDSSTDERLSIAEAIFTAANASDTTDSNVASIKQAAKEYYDHLCWMYENKGPYGIQVGFKDIDTRLQGLKEGELYIVAARPAMGKTTYATNILVNAARAGAKCYFSSLEMPKKQLVQRMIASTGEIPLNELKNGDAVGDQEYSSKFTVALDVVIKLNISIDDQAGVDVADLISRCRAKKRKEGLDLVVIDYLQLLNDRTASNRFDAVSSVSRKIKGLAKELNVPVICLSQLSRAVENRPDKRPMLSDLRESGQIEQDADVIQFLYRDEVYNDNNHTKGICEIITSKFRDGEIGTDRLNFVGSCNKLKDLDHPYVEPAPELKPKRNSKSKKWMDSK